MRKDIIFFSTETLLKLFFLSELILDQNQLVGLLGIGQKI